VISRRRAGRLAVGCLLAVAALTLRAQPLDRWPMFRGSAALTGATDTTLPQPLTLRWSYRAKDAVGSSAAIADGTVYVGSMDGLLHAIDVATGKERWQYQAAGPIEESSPAVSGGLVFVGDVSGVVHAVDAQTGRRRWTFKTDAEVRSSPNPVGDKVYIGSYDQNLYCLLAATGAVVWKFPTDGPVHGTPAFDGGVIYISGCDEYLRAIDATTGRQRFAVSLGSNAGASAAVQDGMAYVGTFGNEVLGIDLKRRGVKWTYHHPTRSFPFYSSAALATDRIVVGGRDKMVHCLSRSTGHVAWPFLTRARVESSSLVSGNRVFVGSNDGTLYELDLMTGKKVWQFTAGAPLPASPAAAGGVLVIGSEDGAVYCFGSAPIPDPPSQSRQSGQARGMATTSEPGHSGR
jgi:outer membrane protein assembly factor BamB